jgi:hypothetical protein
VSPKTRMTSASPPISSIESGEDEPAEAEGRRFAGLFAACFCARVVFFFFTGVRALRTGCGGGGGDAGVSVRAGVGRTGAWGAGEGAGGGWTG